MATIRQDRIQEYESSDDGDEDDVAPIYPIPRRQIVALEHPAFIQNLDRGIASFGTQPDFQRILNQGGPEESSVPLYLNYGNPASGSVASHSVASHDVLLKITIPKRTGRKRKRGSDGPWEGEITTTESDNRLTLDDADALKSKLRDTLDDHKVEVIGLIKQTHRYRSLADYQLRSDNSPFMNDFVANVVPGEVDKLRQFKLRKGTDKPGQVDLIPPPGLTNQIIPFNYAYSQNPLVREIIRPNGERDLINVTAALGSAGYTISYDAPTPDAPRRQPNLSKPLVRHVIAELNKAMEERPIWTRRSLINRLAKMKGSNSLSQDMVRKCLGYVGYQFKGGPWRDAVIKYGLDPRKDPKYREYQTFIYKLRRTNMGETGQSWLVARREANQLVKTAPSHGGPTDSHIFDGQSICQDGKVWQICDITDPLLAELFSRAAIRPKCDIVATGWYHQGLWAKCKGIMKSKINAIRFNRDVPDSAYHAAIAGPNRTPPMAATRAIKVQLPNLHLTDEELATMAVRKYYSIKGEMKKRRWAKSHTIYSQIPRKAREYGDYAGAEASQGEEEDEDDDVEDLTLEDVAGPDLVAEEVDVGLESSSGSSDEDELRDDNEDLVGEGLLEEDEGSDLDDSSQMASSSSRAGDSPSARRGAREGEYDEEEDAEGEEGYYSDGEEYDSGAEVDAEGEEFGGGYYEEEGFADETV